MKQLSRFASCLFFLFAIAYTYAQPEMQRPPMAGQSSSSGTIMGMIVDENAKPIEYASIYVKKTTDSTIAQTGITNESGRFLIQEIPFGEYFIEIQYVGYRKHYSKPFTISKEQSTFRIPKFTLSNKSTSLETVEIKAQKEMLQSNLDKTVFNVESSIMADGATAVEVLEEIPSVDVDVEGNVTVRGSENVTIWVDGRPTNLSLDQIPASMIESIEVITNPSARFDPDGMAGILNVVLKKKKESGFNGMVSLGGGMSLYTLEPTPKHYIVRPYINHYNANVNFNYSYNKINFFINYSYRGHKFKNGGHLDRDSWYGADTTNLNQTNLGQGSGGGHNVFTGLDWFINKKNTLSFSFGFRYGTHKDTSSLSSANADLIEGELFPTTNYAQFGNGKNKNMNFNAAINYKKTFEMKGRELTSDISYNHSFGDNNNWSVQEFDLPYDYDYFQKTKSKSLNRNANAQVDFVTPIGNGGRIETGYKFSYRSIGQDYSLYKAYDADPWALDSTQLNNFEYSEYLNALYFIYSNTFWKKLQIQVGLRGEMANTFSNLKSADTVYKKNYYNLFPTVHIKYDINDKHSIKLSYSRRVQRPNIWQLNPYRDISDKQNVRCGNPYLNPEMANSLELGYQLSIKKTFFSATAFYRHRSHLITRYTTLEQYIPQDTTEDSYIYTLTSYQNLNQSHNIGVELFYSQRIWKFWKINASFNFYRNIIESDNMLDENLARNWEFRFRLNQTFSFDKNWDLQLNFRYSSPSLTTGSMGWGTGGVGQGRRSARYTLDLAVKKGFLKNSLVVSLNIRDILFMVNQTRIHSYQYNDYNGYDSYSLRDRNGCRISLNVTYKINNYKRRKMEMPADDGGMEGGEMEE